jgi:putative hydrolase of the HAD superfamily
MPAVPHPVAGVTKGLPSTRASGFRALFLDIGGVLLTNGWDRHARDRAARAFELDRTELESRHHAAFEAFEEGHLTLTEYLTLVVFHQKRSFSAARFQQFMFAQSHALPDMLDYMARLKRRHDLKIVAVSNEARALNAHRIKAFALDDLVDVFVSSSFVRRRKPDPEIFRLALDLAQVPARQVLFIDDTPLFLDAAKALGIVGLLHRDFTETRGAMSALGLSDDATTVVDRAARPPKPTPATTRGKRSR